MCEEMLKVEEDFFLSLLAAYTVTTLHFPQALQQSRLLSEMILSYP